MSEILYNFAANNSSIGDVNSNLQAIREVGADIDNVFALLMTVYEGEGATALAAAHQKVSAMLNDALYDAGNTQKFAQDQQDAMQSLDRANAAAF